jgi:hypothetical protein
MCFELIKTSIFPVTLFKFQSREREREREEKNISYFTKLSNVCIDNGKASNQKS